MRLFFLIPLFCIVGCGLTPQQQSKMNELNQTIKEAVAQGDRVEAQIKEIRQKIKDKQIDLNQGAIIIKNLIDEGVAAYEKKVKAETAIKVLKDQGVSNWAIGLNAGWALLTAVLGVMSKRRKEAVETLVTAIEKHESSKDIKAKVAKAKNPLIDALARKIGG